MSTPPLPDDDGRVLRFRGATYDEAVTAARDALGEKARVVAAGRVRRGGLGGFFATDLGVEVSVVLDDETIDEALERLVDETAAADRALWLEQLSAATALRPGAGATTAAPAHVPEPVETPTPAAVPRPAAAEPVAAEPVATEPIAAAPITAEPVAAEPIATPAPTPPAEPAPVPSAASRPARVATTPSWGQVDLAVSAAADLIRRAADLAPGGRVAIQVTVTTADGRSVTAEAGVERGPEGTP